MELKILFPHARRAPMNSETQGAVYWSDLPPFCHSKTTRVPAMNIDVGGFVRLFSKHAKRIESIENARKIGARELGIGSWCAAVGIDMELQEVPHAASDAWLFSATSGGSQAHRDSCCLSPECEFLAKHPTLLRHGRYRLVRDKSGQRRARPAKMNVVRRCPLLAQLLAMGPSARVEQLRLNSDEFA